MKLTTQLLLMRRLIISGAVAPLLYTLCAGIAQPVQRLAKGWTVRGSNPGGGEIFLTSSEWAWGPPSLLYSGYRVIPGCKATAAWR